MPVEVVKPVLCCVLVVVVEEAVSVEEAADASPNGQAPLGHRIPRIEPGCKIQHSLCTHNEIRILPMSLPPSLKSNGAFVQKSERQHDSREIRSHD